MGLMDVIETEMPAWASETRFAHWMKLAFTIAAEIDAMVDAAIDGATASMPGQLDGIDGFDGYANFPLIDALPVTGRDRRLSQGLTETPAEYALRQRRYLDAHRRCGAAFAILEQVAAILGPNPPRMRLVSAGGVWWTRETNGDLSMVNTLGRGINIAASTGAVTPNTSVAIQWDWDSHCNPISLDHSDPGRVWLIVYAPANLPYLAGDEGKFGDGATRYGDGLGTADVKTIGTTANEVWVELVRATLREWRAGGILLSHIIVAFDPASFVPTSYVGLPDGWWGWQGKPVSTGGGRYKWVRSRLDTARYIRGVAGTGI